MKAVKISDDIYWVGAIDWDLRNFHGYLTQRGSSYNAYLILDENITLIDNVKSHLYNEMMDRITEIVDPSLIRYHISNHVEMDHSGCLPQLMELTPKATVVTSPNGEKGLRAHYRKDWDFKVVQSGETINLGKHALQFFLTRMVHWPDNMVSYCPQKNILFSNDAFGQHLATSERFDDEYLFNVQMEEAKKYYANIVLPYSMQVKQALDAVSPLNIKLIAPSHGLMWRSFIPEITEEYQKWSSNATERKALIIYDTMWKSTEKIAHEIGKVFQQKGYLYRLLNLQTNHISDIMTELITASHICVGSPTLNNNMLPSVAAFLTYLKGLAPRDRVALAFGSYGWGGQGVDLVEKSLQESKFELLDKIKVQYIPDEQTLKQISEKLEQAID
ncbi:MAG TPA: FprA family A-type flavoprotein [bacterium]|nr:FprA family A-type flavoprotein [bacterium]